MTADIYTIAGRTLHPINIGIRSTFCQTGVDTRRTSEKISFGIDQGSGNKIAGS